jgi:hypothetical protein
MMSTSTSTAAGQPIRRFATDCDAAFRAMLDRYGFRPAAKDASTYLASRVYRCGERYVQVTATTHVLDEQSHCQVYVGEGSHDWPDTDWNKVALWQLAVARGGAQPKGDPYPLRTVADISNILRRMSEDLEREAADFLAGDLRQLQTVRAKVAETRRAYQIWEPQKDGSYQPREDPESAALRSRYAAEQSGRKRRRSKP